MGEFVHSDHCDGCPYDDLENCPLDDGEACPYGIPYGYGETDYMPGE